MLMDATIFRRKYEPVLIFKTSLFTHTILLFPKTEGKKQQIKATDYNTNRFKLHEFKCRQVLIGIGLLQVSLKKPPPFQFLQFSLYIG